MKKYRLLKQPSQETGFICLYKSNKKWNNTGWNKTGNKYFTKEELVKILLEWFKINQEDFPKDWVIEEFEVSIYSTKDFNYIPDFITRIAKKALIKI